MRNKKPHSKKFEALKSDTNVTNIINNKCASTTTFAFVYGL